MWCPNEECPDVEATGSPAEFVEGLTECSFCGAALVSAPPAWADREDEEIQLAPVLPIENAAWLPRVKAILDAAGVRFQLKDARLERGSQVGQRKTGFGWAPGTVLVMVEEGDLERASGLLGDLRAELGLDLAPGEEPPELTAPAWQPSSCPKCGEALESSEDDEPLAYCYHCGAPLA